MFESALVCLALNIYHEAKNQSYLGQLAVGQVVINRVYDERFPDTVCEVVTQGPTYSWKPDFPVRNRCQFSWYCDGKSDIPKEDYAYEVAVMAAEDILYNDINDLTDGSTHYHAYYVIPEWAQTKTQTIRIEDHIFYRWDLGRNK